MIRALDLSLRLVGRKKAKAIDPRRVRVRDPLDPRC